MCSHETIYKLIKYRRHLLALSGIKVCKIVTSIRWGLLYDLSKPQFNQNYDKVISLWKDGQGWLK